MSCHHVASEWLANAASHHAELSSLYSISWARQACIHPSAGLHHPDLGVGARKTTVLNWVEPVIFGKNPASGAAVDLSIFYMVLTRLPSGAGASAGSGWVAGSSPPGCTGCGCAGGRRAALGLPARKATTGATHAAVAGPGRFALLFRAAGLGTRLDDASCTARGSVTRRPATRWSREPCLGCRPVLASSKRVANPATRASSARCPVRQRRRAWRRSSPFGLFMSGRGPAAPVLRCSSGGGPAACAAVAGTRRGDAGAPGLGATEVALEQPTYTPGCRPRSHSQMCWSPMVLVI